MGARLTARQRSLEPSIGVRIPGPQPQKYPRLRGIFLYSDAWDFLIEKSLLYHPSLMSAGDIRKDNLKIY